MIVDIQNWELDPYRTWGFFNVPSHLIQVDVKSLFAYCSGLDSQSITIVFVSTQQLAGINHAFLASYFATKAISNNRNKAKDLGMELLLYISRQNQIYTAITRAGISDQQKNGHENWAIIFFSSSTQCFLAEKIKLETYLKTSLLEPLQNAQPSHLLEELNLKNEINPLHLAVLEKFSQIFPRLPVKPTSSQEVAFLQVLIEKMVLLSLEEIRSES